MKHPLFILAGGLALAAAGFGSAYHISTAHSPEKSPKPELAWLRAEYRLNDKQYESICELYAAYHPQCLEMCRQIDAQNARLEMLLPKTNVVTPEIRKALEEQSELRARCEANMMDYFYAVSKEMPPDEGRRYLAWIQKETLIPSPMANKQSTNSF